MRPPQPDPIAAASETGFPALQRTGRSPLTVPEPIPVGIALVSRNGHYLIRQRPALPGSPMPGLWEFPGGKCEARETPAEAAARECREEAGLDVAVARLRMAINHRYPHGLVALSYFDCRCTQPAAEPLPASGFCWVPARELPSLHFPEANQPVLEALAREAAGADSSPRI